MIKNKAGADTTDGPVEKKSKFASSDVCSGLILMIKSQSPFKSSH